MLFLEIKNCLFDNYILLLKGLQNTIFIWICTILISFFLGFVWGLHREERLFPWYITKTFDILAYVIQGVPLYLQLLIFFFIIAPFFKIYNAMFIGIISLGFCSAAYSSQIIKTSLNTISQEQWMLARGMGYSKWQTVYFIIIPQMLIHLIPLFINECDQLLKSISILSTLGILDFTRTGLNIINVTFKPIPVYIILFCVFLLSSLLLRYTTFLYNKKINNEGV
jgi:polar amino acid transport system permease protein